MLSDHVFGHYTWKLVSRSYWYRCSQKNRTNFEPCILRITMLLHHMAQISMTSPKLYGENISRPGNSSFQIPWLFQVLSNCTNPAVTHHKHFLDRCAVTMELWKITNILLFCLAGFVLVFASSQQVETRFSEWSLDVNSFINPCLTMVYELSSGCDYNHVKLFLKRSYPTAATHNV